MPESEEWALLRILDRTCRSRFRRIDFNGMNHHTFLSTLLVFRSGTTITPPICDS